MDKTTLEQKRQQASEALVAWKDAVKQTIDASDGKIKPGEGIKPEQFTAELREKQEKAKADYTTLANELAGAESLARDETEIAKAEEDLSKPAPRGASGTPGPSEQNVSILARKAEQLERNADPWSMTSEQSNYLKTLKAEAHIYQQLALSADQRTAWRNYWTKLMVSGHPGQDSELDGLRKKLYEVVPKEKLAMLITGNAGNLAPEEFIAEVLRDLPGFSNFRRLARVVRTGKDQIVWPTIKAATDVRADQGYVSGFTGSFKATRSTTGGGLALTTQDQPEWGRLNIKVHRWEPDAIEFDLETMEDPDVDVEGILSSVIAETKGTDEEAEFTSGDGVGRPFGILSDNIRGVQSGTTLVLTYGGATTGFLGLYAALRGQYRQNATWMMNSQSFSAALGLEDSGSTLIFPPNALPNTLFGRPVAFNEFMPDPDVDGNQAVIFGDFSHYIIADRMQLRVMRLVERAAPNIALLPIARLGGQVSRTNAFKVMTIGAEA